MKRLLTLLIAILGIAAASAQDCRIPLAIKITDNTGKANTADTDNLASALRQAMTANGFTGAEESSRFALVASVAQTGQEIVGGVRPTVTVNLDINLYVVNVFTGEQFTAETLSLSGAATSEATAYRKALGSLKGSNTVLERFMGQASRDVLAYYDKQLPSLLREVDALAAQRDFTNAMWILSSIPPCAKSYDKVLRKMDDVFGLYINLDCSQKVQAARAVWTATQDLDGAQAAVALLAVIDPEADCGSDANRLLKEIAEAVKTINADNADAEQDLLDFYKEMQRAQIENERARIEAMRAIGKAYGENQQQQTIIIH